MTALSATLRRAADFLDALPDDISEPEIKQDQPGMDLELRWFNWFNWFNWVNGECTVWIGDTNRIEYEWDDGTKDADDPKAKGRGNVAFILNAAPLKIVAAIRRVCA